MPLPKALSQGSCGIKRRAAVKAAPHLAVSCLLLPIVTPVSRLRNASGAIRCFLDRFSLFRIRARRLAKLRLSYHIRAEVSTFAANAFHGETKMASK